MSTNCSGKCLANEIDGPGSADDDTYYRLAKESYEHGAQLISVANWHLPALLERKQLFQDIARYFLEDDVAVEQTGAQTMRISARQALMNGTDRYIEQYQQLSSRVPVGQMWCSMTTSRGMEQPRASKTTEPNLLNISETGIY